jgi:carbamoyltransferase
MTTILGINAFHGDAAACLVRDGRMLAAAEEERFRRIKHWAGFPSQAIAWCLADAGIGLADVDHVAINQDPRAHWWRKAAFALRQRPDPRLVLDRLRNRRARAGIAAHLADAAPGQVLRAQVHHVEHHAAHLSSAFHVSPFDEACVASVDGFGDFASAAWGVGRGSRIELDERVHFPHSLGIFYQAITQFIGFPNYGDEYKVMGLAPYGEPRYLDEMRRIVRLQPGGGFRLDLDCFRHHREKIAYEWSGGSPMVGALHSSELARRLGPARRTDEPLEQRHKDIARSAQAMYEEAFFHLLNALHAKHKLRRVALAGGCAMNSVANGKVTLHTPFEEVYVQSAAGDAGGAVGAAYHVWHALGGARRETHDHAYWGPAFGDDEIAQLLRDRAAELEAAGCRVHLERSDEQLARSTAEAIARGEVVGWFQGRMEWGPRALGNRSIVCDPRRSDMKDILNLKIKRRESFRPFAPSVLREAAGEWFELDGDVPFMMQVYPIRAGKRASIPAVTHVDGTGRLQTVAARTNPRYHALIAAFRELTGVPMVLNTSFNENEPVVCTPSQALDCFLRTNMDRLVLGSHAVWRSAASQSEA